MFVLSKNMELQNFALIAISILKTSRSFLVVRQYSSVILKYDEDRATRRSAWRAAAGNNKYVITPSHIPVTEHGETFVVEPNLLPLI